MEITMDVNKAKGNGKMLNYFTQRKKSPQNAQKLKLQNKENKESRNSHTIKQSNFFDPFITSVQQSH